MLFIKAVFIFFKWALLFSAVLGLQQNWEESMGNSHIPSTPQKHSLSAISIPHQSRFICYHQRIYPDTSLSPKAQYFILGFTLGIVPFFLPSFLLFFSLVVKTITNVSVLGLNLSTASGPLQGCIEMSPVFGAETPEQVFLWELGASATTHL